MSKRMFVVAKIAQTLDGKIATSSGQSKWITGQKTRDFARARRDQFNAIMVGINTVLKDDPLLTGVRNQDLKKIVVDSRLGVGLKAKLFKNVLPGQCIIATTKQASAKKIKVFERKDINILICKNNNGRVDLIDLFKKLTDLNIKSVLIEGGAKLVGAALKAGLVDEMNIYLAPSIIGDDSARSSITGFRIQKVNHALKLSHLKIKKIANDIFIEAKVN